MEAFYNYLNELVSKNKAEFSEVSPEKWVNSYNVPEQREKRQKLLQNLQDSMLYSGTKPYHNQISEGCKLCAAGQWSCLFITGKCNAKCFYCPTAQAKDEVPASHGLSFKTPELYADYINHFKFKGVSFSGGEPFLVFDRTLKYLKEIRKSCDPEIYTWVYTNGILADSDKIKLLADAGLNELRFDIGAVHYLLDKPAIAKGIIPNVTIEIPAIPEETEKLKKILPDMIRAGVTHLNLHQLRLTKHNMSKLLARDYHFVASEKPLVLESEIAALEILDYAKKSGLEIGINYCSFDYKNRFQKAGFKRQTALAAECDQGNITRNGYIRKYSGNKIQYDFISLNNSDCAENKNGLPGPIHLRYSIMKLSSMPEVIVPENLIPELEQLIAENNGLIPADEFLFRIWQMENTEENLREI